MAPGERLHPTASNSSSLPDSRDRQPRGAEGDVGFERGHHFVEGVEVERLFSIAPGLVGMGMHFDDEAVGLGSNGYAGEGRHKLAMTCGMARVGDDGKMRNLLEQRDGADVERVAGGGFKSADAALAEHDVGIAVGENALRRAQKVGDGRDHAAFQQDRPAGAPCSFKQRVVLHIAGADLQDVGVLGDHGDVVFRHHLGDDGEAGLLTGARQQLEALKTEALKCIRRTARLEGSSAKNAGARTAHMIGGGHELQLGFNRARPSHGDELVCRRSPDQAPEPLTAGAYHSSEHPVIRQTARASFRARPLAPFWGRLRLLLRKKLRLHPKIEDRWTYLPRLSTFVVRTRMNICL